MHVRMPSLSGEWKPTTKRLQQTEKVHLQKNMQTLNTNHYSRRRALKTSDKKSLLLGVLGDTNSNLLGCLEHYISNAHPDH